MGFKFLDRSYNDVIGQTLGVTQKLNNVKIIMMCSAINCENSLPQEGRIKWNQKKEGNQ